MQRYCTLVALVILILFAGERLAHSERGSRENTPDACRDGVDNDRDGHVDCDDFECRSLRFCVPLRPENTADACRDGIDNDQDGNTDCGDEECMALVFCARGVAPTPEPARPARGPRPRPENNAQVCRDGVDNDQDGLFDCFDPDCSPLPVCAPTRRSGGGRGRR